MSSISVSSSTRVCTVERDSPTASTGMKNHGSASSGSSALPMLLFPELEAPLSRMIRPACSAVTGRHYRHDAKSERRGRPAGGPCLQPLLGAVDQGRGDVTQFPVTVLGQLGQNRERL